MMNIVNMKQQEIKKQNEKSSIFIWTRCFIANHAQFWAMDLR